MSPIMMKDDISDLLTPLSLATDGLKVYLNCKNYWGDHHEKILLTQEIVAKALDGQQYPCPAQVGCGLS